MREARPLDLSYGHLGRPVYDSENHEWCFPRHPYISRQLRPLGAPSIALASSSRHSDHGVQNAADRLANTKGLTKIFPELQPATPLLPGFAHLSEAVSQRTSSHEPTISDLLVFGQANCSDGHGNNKPVPIVAVAGGLAGEAVRLALCTNEQLRWGGEKNLYLNSFSCKSGEESLWRGSSSPLQQIVFAETEGQPSSWLAARYHGTLSILHPQYRRDKSNSTLRSDGALGSRLDPNPIVTLSLEGSQNVPFADVAFNPWDHQQIATIHQDGHWSIWVIRGIAPERGLWTIERSSGGSLSDKYEDEQEFNVSCDGWGKVLWGGSLNRLIAMNRRKLEIIDVDSNGTKLDVPDLFGRKSTDWILDVKKSSVDDNHIFVVTSSTLFWIKFPTANDIDQPGVQCLLSWKHFIAREDISLSLNILRIPEDMHATPNTADTVLLYSRLNEMIAVFTFQHPNPPTNHAISTLDPFRLPIVGLGREEFNSLAAHHDLGRAKLPIINVAMRAIPYGFNHTKPPSRLGQQYLDCGIKFYQLSVLFQDLSLSEHLYAEAAAGLDFEIRSPDSRIRKQLPKTPKVILDDFVVPDGFEDVDSEERLSEMSMEQSPEEKLPSTHRLCDQEARSTSLKWLERKLHVTLSGSDAIVTEDFSEVLQDLYDKIKVKSAVEDRTMRTLLEPERTKVYINDLDKAAFNFAEFLQNIAGPTLMNQEMTGSSIDKGPAVLTKLTLPIWDFLGLKDSAQVLGLYDSLIEVWIGPLSRNVPSRTRIFMDKLMRNMTGQMCLASYAALPHSTQKNEDITQGKASASRFSTEFTLPVRKRASSATESKGKQPAARSSSPLALSPLSDEVGVPSSSPLRTLPTPEPTPSVRSWDSVPPFVEDPASQQLKSYANLAPQPALPVKLSNILDHWQLGNDPETYDWKAVQQAFANDDEEELGAHEKEQQRAKKHPKRQREATFGPSSQPEPKRLGGSQPQQRREDGPESSQGTESMATASQVLPGPFGSRPRKGKKKKRFGVRPAGFK